MLELELLLWLVVLARALAFACVVEGVAAFCPLAAALVGPVLGFIVLAAPRLASTLETMLLSLLDEPVEECFRLGLTGEVGCEGVGIFRRLRRMGEYGKV